jgi:hypothetical protein
MFINPLAAYVILMVSEIGHSLQTFNNNNGEGWRLLRVLMNGGKFDQVIRVTLEIMPTFLRSSQHQYGDSFINPQILEEENFALFWREFWSRVALSPRTLSVSTSSSNSSLTSPISVDFKNVFSVSLRTLFAAEQQSERDVYVVFWIACACSDPSAAWMSSRSRVRILDMLFEISLSSFHQNRVYGSSFEKTLWEISSERLSLEYQKLLEGYAKLNPSSSSAYSVIGRIAGSGYPSLIGGSTNSAFSTAPSALPSLIQQLAYSNPVKVEKECLWFAVEALRIEMNEERTVRELIGQQLSKDPNITLQDAMKQVFSSFPELQKPLLNFSIMKLAHHIVSINVEHPLLILFCQVKTGETAGGEIFL